MAIYPTVLFFLSSFVQYTYLLFLSHLKLNFTNNIFFLRWTLFQQTGPNDVVVPYKENNENEYDDYAAKEMAKKGYKGRVSDRIDPKSLRFVT